MRWSDLRDVNKEDMLALLGLQPKRGFLDVFLPGLGLFGAGLLVGAGLGMMLAPQSGYEMRRGLLERYGQKMTSGQPQPSPGPM